MEHNWHLTNFGADELSGYLAAIATSGRELSIRFAAFDCQGRLSSREGYSLWCSALEGDLTDFWSILEPE